MPEWLPSLIIQEKREKFVLTYAEGISYQFLDFFQAKMLIKMRIMLNVSCGKLFYHIFLTRRAEALGSALTLFAPALTVLRGAHTFDAVAYILQVAVWIYQICPIEPGHAKGHLKEVITMLQTLASSLDSLNDQLDAPSASIFRTWVRRLPLTSICE